MQLGQLTSSNDGDATAAMSAWAISALTKIASSPSMRGAILNAGGLPYLCDLCEAVSMALLEKGATDEEAGAVAFVPRPPRGPADGSFQRRPPARSGLTLSAEAQAYLGPADGPPPSTATGGGATGFGACAQLPSGGANRRNKPAPAGSGFQKVSGGGGGGVSGGAGGGAGGGGFGRTRPGGGGSSPTTSPPKTRGLGAAVGGGGRDSPPTPTAPPPSQSHHVEGWADSPSNSYSALPPARPREGLGEGGQTHADSAPSDNHGGAGGGDGAPLVIPPSVPGALRNLFRALCFADAAHLDATRDFGVGADVLLLLGRYAIGGDVQSPQVVPSANSTAALAAASAAAASIGATAAPLTSAGGTVPPSSLVANSRLALGTLLLRPSNCDALAIALRAGASRARHADVEHISVAAAALSALLLAATATSAVAPREGSHPDGACLHSPTDERSRLALLTTTLGVATSAHMRAHRLLGDAHRPPRLEAMPAVLSLLGSERPELLAAATELVALFCRTRPGRSALVGMAGSPLHLIAELLSYHVSSVRLAVLAVLLALSEDKIAAQAVTRTPAVQGLLDLVECERIDDEDAAGTVPSASGSQLAQALQVLVQLLQHDDEGALLELVGEHPAVEDLECIRKHIKEGRVRRASMLAPGDAPLTAARTGSQTSASVFAGARDLFWEK